MDFKNSQESKSREKNWYWYITFFRSSLSWTLYRNPSHTSRYVNAKSQHHPQKSVQLPTIFQTDKHELECTWKPSTKGFSDYTIRKAIKLPEKLKQTQNTNELDLPQSYLLYINVTTKPKGKMQLKIPSADIILWGYSGVTSTMSNIEHKIDVNTSKVNTFKEFHSKVTRRTSPTYEI